MEFGALELVELYKVRIQEQWVLKGLSTPVHIRLALWNLSSSLGWEVPFMSPPRGACVCEALLEVSSAVVGVLVCRADPPPAPGAKFCQRQR